MYEYDIFLSHNGADKVWVERLATDIENNKDGKQLCVFFDKWDIEAGANIPIVIENALQKSRYIGLVMSPEAFSSEWVTMERSVAMMVDPSAKNQHIIPIYRKACDIPYTLKRIKYLDFSKEELYQSSLEQLLAILRDIPLKRGREKGLEEMQLQDDQRLLEEILYAFERPAFRVPCIRELFIKEMLEAIDDVQAALNTGKLYSRHHNFLREIGAISQFKTHIYRNTFFEVQNSLSELKRMIVEFERFYKTMYPDFNRFENFMEMYLYINKYETEERKYVLDKMDEIDKARNHILKLINGVNINLQRQLSLIELSSVVIPSWFS